jgi:hypothetical protein
MQYRNIDCEVDIVFRAFKAFLKGNDERAKRFLSDKLASVFPEPKRAQPLKAG